MPTGLPSKMKVILASLCFVAITACEPPPEAQTALPAAAINVAQAEPEAVIGIPAPVPNSAVTVATSNTVSSSTATSTPKTTATPNATATSTTAMVLPKADASGVQTLNWDNLMPPGYDPQSIMARYGDRLNALDDGDPEAMRVFGEIQAELNNAPVNVALDGSKVRIPGFMAPLENDEGEITDFLLVPYFGACIHTPPPPVNQTVLVGAKPGDGISSEEWYSPVWVTGTLSSQGEKTDIGEAGYSIMDARVELYEETSTAQ